MDAIKKLLLNYEFSKDLLSRFSTEKSELRYLYLVDNSMVSYNFSACEKIHPLEYLENAQENLLKNSKVDLVNCVSNTKKGIERIIDILLCMMGFEKKLADFTFPIKLEIVTKFGYFPKVILSEINSIRGRLEHNHDSVSYSEAQKMYEIGDLFVKYALLFTKNFVNGLYCAYENDDRDIYWEIGSDSLISICEYQGARKIDSQHGSLYYVHGDREQLRRIEEIKVDKYNFDASVPYYKAFFYLSYRLKVELDSTAYPDPNEKLLYKSCCHYDLNF